MADVTVTEQNSVYMGGQWLAAHWALEAFDPGTGEVILSATVARPPHDVVVLRVGMDLVEELRKLAGGQRTLRRATDGTDEEETTGCYDCRTNCQRIEALERMTGRWEALAEATVGLTAISSEADVKLLKRIEALEDQQRQVGERLMQGEREAAAAEKALGERLTALEGIPQRMATTNAAEDGFCADPIETADAAVYDEFHVEWERDEWRNEVERLRTALDSIATLEGGDPDGRVWTWKELFVRAEAIAKEALNGTANDA